MSLPAKINVTIDFSGGPVFGIAFTIGDPKNGVIGVNVLADKASDVVDISSQTVKIDVARGRNIIQDRFEAGTATVRVIDYNGDWNPENPSSPYYGKLIPLRKVRISADYNGNSYFLFSGYSQNYKYTFPTNETFGYVDIECTDAFRLFNMAGVNTVTGATAGQDTGTRINKILDMVSWPTSMREVSTGQTTCIADPSTQRSVLAALQTAEFSEQGAFFIDQEGDAVFYNRTETIQKAGGTPVVFNQTGTGIPYKSVVYAFDDKLIVNNTNVTRVGGTKQTATDTDSINKYFIHTINATDMVMETDADALNVAKAYTASHKDTSIRIDSMTLDLNSEPYTAGITAALGLRFFDPVQITNTTASGSTITKTLQVLGVSHSITPNTWLTTFSTQEPIIDGFIVGNAQYGIIGQSVMTY